VLVRLKNLRQQIFAGKSGEIGKFFSVFRARVDDGNSVWRVEEEGGAGREWHGLSNATHFVSAF
jgi:hypothetical protein